MARPSKWNAIYRHAFVQRITGPSRSLATMSQIVPLSIIFWRRPDVHDLLYANMACEITGVGVKPAAASTKVSMPFATRNSTTVAKAARDTARVSMPRSEVFRRAVLRAPACRQGGLRWL